MNYTNWHEKKLMEARLRQQINNTEPCTPTVWQHRWKRRLLTAGYTPFKAVVDYAGNCVYCGEAGRCPGWHIYDGRMNQVAKTQAILTTEPAQQP